MTDNPRFVIMDTSVIIDAFHFDAAVLRQLQVVHMLVPVVVLGELYIGAYGASRQGAQFQKIDDLISSSTVITSTPVTAQHYGRIKQILRGRGLLIPDNDIWIAAIALEHNVPVATRDNHFERIDGLVVERW